MDAVQPRPLLVVRVHHVPRRLRDVAHREHPVLGLGIVHPARARLEVHRAELPALRRIVDPRPEPLLLLFVRHREPVLDEDDARPHQHALELRTRAQEFLVFRLRAEPHHVLHARAVVPAAVEQHHFPRGGQVRHVALEIPLRFFLVRGRAQGHHAADAGIQAFRDALDRAALARGVAPLEDRDHPQPLLLDPLLELHQLDLQLGELLLVLELLVLLRPVLLRVHAQFLRGVRPHPHPTPRPRPRQAPIGPVLRRT